MSYGIEPRTPVIVGAAQLTNRDGDAEPIAMMSAVGEAALSDVRAESLRERIDSVRVVKGIWPYADPGRLLIDELGFRTDARTAITQLGGNEAYDLVNRTAADISAGSVDAALVVSAETMRTRRRDKAGGRLSPYRTEVAGAEPDVVYGTDEELVDQTDIEAAVYEPVTFYAMVESALRHHLGESVDENRRAIAELWARASAVAASNPHAVILDRRTADEIGTPAPNNRMVASPYTKLMTSNIDVDQAAALVMCSAEIADAAGVPRERLVFPHAGSGAHDHWLMRSRPELHRSPAMRIAGTAALEHAEATIDDIEMLDLYSCFPSAVRLAQLELGIERSQNFTVPGGMTFAGGPYNSYCMHAAATAVGELRRLPASRAFFTGNGGFFTKHSFLLLGGSPPTTPFAYVRPQDEVDQLPRLDVADDSASAPSSGLAEAYTVLHDRSGQPVSATLAVLADGRRWWATATDPSLVARFRDEDLVGRSVTFAPGKPPVVTGIV